MRSRATAAFATTDPSPRSLFACSSNDLPVYARNLDDVTGIDSLQVVEMADCSEEDGLAIEGASCYHQCLRRRAWC